MCLLLLIAFNSHLKMIRRALGVGQIMIVDLSLVEVIVEMALLMER